jgi:magnesium transporter
MADKHQHSRLQQLSEALLSGRLMPVRRMLNDLHPSEIALMLESLPPRERLVVWELVDADQEGDVLVHVNDEVRASLIESMDTEELVAATGSLDTDDLADILQDLPEAVTREVLRSMDKQNRHLLEAVLSYPEDSAGGLMNTDAVTVRADVTLDAVTRYLRLRGAIPDLTDSLIVINRFDMYLGLLPLTKLLTSEPSLSVGEVMNRDAEAIPASLPEQEVATRFERHDLVSAPVVDDDGRLLGRITIDDVVDVIRDEAEHSLRSLAGLDEESDMFAPVLKSTRRRALWLGINLVTAFIASWAIGRFEDTLQQVVALAVLMPIVASMGGVAGSQTLTLTVRGIALGQVNASNARWLMRKELAIALVNGVIWAVVVGLIAIFWFDDYKIGIVIAVAVAINLACAALAGLALPLMMKRMGIDPAIAGTVALTTVTDVVGFVAFLGLATMFLI